MAMLVCQWVQLFGLDWNISTTFGWIALKFCTDIHGAQRINPNDFGDPLTFPLAPPAGITYHLSCKISQHLFDGLAQILFKHSLFPEDDLAWLWRSPGFSWNTIMRMTFIILDGLPWNLVHHIPVPLIMNCGDFFVCQLFLCLLVISKC